MVGLRRNMIRWLPMIFSRKNVGKWVASKKGKIVDSDYDIAILVRRIKQRSDRDSICFDKVPPLNFIGIAATFVLFSL